MIKNGKYYLAPDGQERDFKSLFRQMAAAGAGRIVDEQGIPEGPWTPELLTETISQIDANQSGIDLRTVQLWFQDNNRGISAENIRWLARIFGCGDPDATSEWQRELFGAQSRLATKRRKMREVPASTESSIQSSSDPALGGGNKPQASIAVFTEALFDGSTRLEIPGAIFAGGVILGFVSIMLDIGSYEHVQSGGVVKQIGFLWAPNWTAVTWFLMPLFAFTVADVVSYWKTRGRESFSETSFDAQSDTCWIQKVQSFSTSFWIIFVVSLPIAFFLQWVVYYLLPLAGLSTPTQADNWGLIAMYDPAARSVLAANIFTFFAYLYLGACIYIFFSGLLLIHVVGEDIHACVTDGSAQFGVVEYHPQISLVNGVLARVFRCAIVGLMIPTVIKLQQAYLSSPESNIADWVVGDFQRLWVNQRRAASVAIDNSVSTHFTSILIVLSTSVMFFGVVLRLRPILATQESEARAREVGSGCVSTAPLGVMVGLFGLLLVNYALIGTFSGFSALLLFATIVGVIGALKPASNYWQR